MKRTLFIMSLLMTLLVGVQSCSSDDDDDKVGMVSTDKTTITFMAQQGVSEYLNIIANKEWTVSGMPEWLNASAISGRGNSTITLTTKTANNSAEERRAELTIRSGEKVTYVTVTQESKLVADCIVKPTNIVTLATGTAFDFSYGSKVAYFYRAVYTPTTTERYTEDEIIAVITKDIDNRITPNDDVVSSKTGMSPLTKYIIYTIGFDKDGNRGELIKTEIRTKNNRNQAVAEISDVKYDDTKWYWQTSPDGYTERYYQWFIDDENLYEASDPAIAWFFTDAMKSNGEKSDFAPIVKAQGWQRKRSSNFFHLMTWAKDVDGEFSGIIDRWKGIVSTEDNAARIKRMSSKTTAKQQAFRKSDYKEVK